METCESYGKFLLIKGEKLIKFSNIVYCDQMLDKGGNKDLIEKQF